MAITDGPIFSFLHIKRNRAWPLRHALAGGLSLLSLSACGTADESKTGAAHPPPFEIVETTIGKIQAALKTGDASCRDVVQAYLTRIESYDKSKGLNAITVINPNALKRADEIDDALKAGAPLPPLFCAPLLVKDNFDTHDLPTTGGSIVLKDSYPPDDAFMVRRLRAAGAIVIAKTNMAEWAFSPKRTESSSFGVTANAYALDHVPAGSSGGTASAVAANFGVAGLGSDTGNSIRGPSSHLALFGIRSTIGLTSRDGVIPLAWDRDIAGPMTRTVEDAARIFNVIAGYDPADSMTELGKDRREPDYTAFLKKDALRGVRIGVLRALSEREGADPQIHALFERAIADLKTAGAIIVDPFEIPNLDRHLNTDNFCARFRYDMHLYLKSLGANAPIMDVMEAYRAGKYAPYAKEAFAYFGDSPLDIPPEKMTPPCLLFPNHPGRKAFQEDVIAAMDAASVDALIYPTWNNPPATLARAEEDYKGDNSQLIAPDTGMPAATIPMGYSHGALPAGLQMLGRPFSEGRLFGYAYAYEQATHHRRPPPEFP